MKVGDLVRNRSLHPGKYECGVITDFATHDSSEKDLIKIFVNGSESRWKRTVFYEVIQVKNDL